MTASTIASIVIGIIIGIVSLVLYAILYVGSNYDRDTEKYYRKHYPQMYPMSWDADELTRRITEYYRRENPDPISRQRRIFITLPGKTRPIQVWITDNREEYLVKLGIYDEQINNFIHFIKSELDLYGHGMP